MLYNFKRAVGLAFLLYIATFVVGIAVGVLSGQDMSSMENISDSFWYVGMVAAVVFALLFAHWYFKNPSIVPSAKSGFLFGLTTVALSTLLDVIFFSIGNAQGASVDLSQYYTDFRFWIIVLLVLLTTTVVGAKKAPKILALPQ